MKQLYSRLWDIESLGGMSRYSLDIRRKVVTAYQLGNTSIRKLAQQFMMSPVTVQKYLNQYRNT